MLENQKLILPVLLEDLGRMYATVLSKNKTRYGLYNCMCGKSFKAITADIKSGNTKSCGCLKITHHMTNHRLYKIWNNMMQRCQNEKVDSYQYYGGRGIKVCDRWINVKNFIDDMDSYFQYGLSIDRINSDGNYDPVNCRWSTAEIQSRNKRTLQVNNTSGYRGVTWDDAHNKWRTRIMVSSKAIHIGRFNTAEEAARAYDKYVIDNKFEHSINFKYNV